MSSPPISAFISYAKADQAKAQEIADLLEQRSFRCWIAPRDVRPGRAYGDEIIRGIEGARALILVLSSASNESGFVSREIERAVSKNKHIFTVRLEDVLPSPALELFISSTQWIDAFSGRIGPHVDRLAQLLAEDEAADTDASAPRPLLKPPSRRPLWRSPLFLAAGATGLLAVAGIAAVLLMPRGGEGTGEQNNGAATAFEHGFFGADTRRELDRFEGEEKEKLLAKYAYVGVLANQSGPVCNATLVGENLILTSSYCFSGPDPKGMTFEMRGRDGKMLQSALTDVLTGPAIRGAGAEAHLVVAKLAQPVGDKAGWVKQVGGDPTVGAGLDIVAIDLRRSAAGRTGVMVSGASTGDPNCAVLGRQAGTDTFAHHCISPMGSGGAPIFDTATGALLGIVGETDKENRIALAYRADGVPALIRQAEPDMTAPKQASLSGTWTGSGHQTGGGGDPVSYPVVMRISDQGGSSDYPSLGCGGSLTALSAEGGEAQYKEHITYGDCVDGGTIVVKLKGGKLDWQWSGIGDIVVTAELESAGK
jgi:hypothetical protein